MAFETLAAAFLNNMTSTVAPPPLQFAVSEAALVGSAAFDIQAAAEAFAVPQEVAAAFFACSKCAVPHFPEIKIEF